MNSRFTKNHRNRAGEILFFQRKSCQTTETQMSMILFLIQKSKKKRSMCGIKDSIRKPKAELERSLKNAACHMSKQGCAGHQDISHCRHSRTVQPRGLFLDCIHTHRSETRLIIGSRPGFQDSLLPSFKSST